ncbi:MAG: rhombosortase, partial [Burkholderiales bacterium]
MPWLTLAIVSGALVTQCVPGIAELLVYDRAAITGGELWRVITGHSVHFSSSHLLFNVIVIGAAGSLIEAQDRRDLVELYALSAVLIGLFLFLGEPSLRQFGGLSGIAYALVVYVALSGVHGSGRWRLVCFALSMVVCAKLLAETLLGWSLTATGAD